MTEGTANPKECYNLLVLESVVGTLVASTHNSPMGDIMFMFRRLSEEKPLTIFLELKKLQVKINYSEVFICSNI